MREKISACVITFNEEAKIRRCLRSLAWCDEIIVLDSFSTDRTLERCREFTAEIHQNEWLGYVGQRNLVRELSHYPWVLFLDADEEISPGLRDQILREFDTDPGRYNGYEFPRKVFYLGRWVNHGEWYPDVKMRLFKKAYGRTEGQEPHDRVVLKGPVKRLHDPIWHYTYDDIRDHIDTINRFSSIAAQQRFVEEIPFRWVDLLFRPFLRFLKGYLLRLGFLDGTHGFLIAILGAFGVYVKYAKHLELVRKQDGRFKALPDA